MKKQILILFATLTLIVSCKSPLLNHVQAAPAGAATQTSSDENKACPLSFPKSGLCASLSWDSPPVEGQDSPFTLRFWNSKDSSKDGPYSNPSQTVFAKLWMKSMGHGSSPITTTHAKDSAGGDIIGIYHSTNVFFIMGGDWEIKIQLKQGSSIIEEAELPVTI